jgi:hypothetical protein
MRVAKILPIVIGCVLVLGIWYWRTHLTYAGEVSRFESRVQKQVDPAQLQQWAITTLARYSTSKV